MKYRGLLAGLGFVVAALWAPAVVDAWHFRQTESAHAAAFASDYSWTALGNVAHALGSGDYRNTRDAFLESYEAGFRVFEVDLAFTSDGHLVVSHGWRRAPTLEAFLAGGGAGALRMADLADLLRQHPDIWLILDPKDEPSEVWAAVAAEGERNQDVLDRMIPQLLHPGEYAETLDIHPFRSLVLTTSRLAGWSRAVVDWALRHHVRVIAIEHQSADSTLIARMRGRGGWVYAHPVNDCGLAISMDRMGVHGIYTGHLRPSAPAC